MCLFIVFAIFFIKKHLFLRLQFNYVSSFPQTLSYPFFALLQTYDFFINYYCMHICICVYTYIPKNKLLSPYKATCMYFGELFGTVQSIGVLFSGETTFSDPRFIQLPVALCVGLRPYGSWHVFGAIFVQLMFSGHVGKANFWSH